MPKGRVMVNCGGIDGTPDLNNGTVHPNSISTDDSWVQNLTIQALSEAFPGQVGAIPLIHFELYLFDFHPCI